MIEDLTENEIYLINLVRESVPFEIIEIHKDKLGQADTFLVKRSHKIMVTPQEIRAVKIKVSGF